MHLEIILIRNHTVLGINQSPVKATSRKDCSYGRSPRETTTNRSASDNLIFTLIRKSLHSRGPETEPWLLLSKSVLEKSFGFHFVSTEIQMRFHENKGRVSFFGGIVRIRNRLG